MAAPNVKDNFRVASAPVTAATTSDFIADVAARQQYTFLGDTAHDKPDLRELAGAPATMAALSRSGVRHMCIEMNENLQWIADDFAQGRMNREQFISTMGMIYTDRHGSKPGDHARNLNALADMVENGKRNGIRVHYVDTMGGFSQTADAAQATTFQDRMLRQWSDQIRQNPSLTKLPQDQQTARFQEMARTEFGKLPETQRNSIAQGFADLQRVDANARLQKDPEVAARIQALTGGDKTVIYYGNYHSSRLAGDIDASLGEGNTATINLYASHQAQADQRGRMIKPDERDKPQYSLYIQENEVIDDKNRTTRLGRPADADPAPDASPPERQLAAAPAAPGGPTA